MSARRTGAGAQPCPHVGTHVEDLLRGDFARGLSAFCEDVVWHVPGEDALSGRHCGREAMLALLELMFMDHAAAHLVTHPLGAHDAYRFEWVEAQDAGREWRRGWPVISRLDGGRVREVWWCRTGCR